VLFLVLRVYASPRERHHELHASECVLHKINKALCTPGDDRDYNEREQVRIIKRAIRSRKMILTR